MTEDKRSSKFYKIASTQTYEEGVAAFKKREYEIAFQIFNNLAEKGDPESQGKLSEMYRYGLGVPENWEKALDWEYRAAKNGHLFSQFIIGIRYKLGLKGKQPDPTKAAEWLSKAAEKGYPAAQVELGGLYINGKGVEKNCEKGVELHLKAHEKGLPMAHFRLGLLYAEGRCVKMDHAKAEELFLLAANKGDTQAQEKLGSMYLLGRGVEQNSEEAAKWFLRIAEKGHSKIRFYVGNMYHNGIGVKLDKKHAMEWFKKALEAWWAPDIPYILGLMFYKGQIVEQNYEQAAKLFSQRTYFPGSQHMLGLIYDKGQGVGKNAAEAHKWYGLAGDGGEIEAKIGLFGTDVETETQMGKHNQRKIKFYEAYYVLGLLYAEGHEVEQDFEGAAKWYLKAAELGDFRAQYHLGVFYSEGLGVAKNITTAKKWLRKAANQGHQKAQGRLGFIYYKHQNTAEDVERAKKWLRLAADQDDSIAQYLLGRIYTNLYNADADDNAQAVYWYRKAAEKGNIDALKSLADMYMKGYGVKQNYEEALSLYLKSAEKGNVFALYEIGNLYKEGKGVRQDNINAYKFLYLAYSTHEEKFLNYDVHYSVFDESILTLLEKEMSFTEIQKAKKSAQEWATQRGFEIL